MWGSTTETDAGSGRLRHRSGLGWLIQVVACDPSLKPPTSRRALAVPLTRRVACADRAGRAVPAALPGAGRTGRRG